MKNTVGYFIEGLKIIGDFRKIFFISLLFTLFSTLLTFVLPLYTSVGSLVGSPWGFALGIPLGIVWIFVSYYSVGYGVSIPLFLHDTEKDNPTDASHIYSVTANAAHRLFLVMLIYLFFILGGVGIFSFFLLLGAPSYVTVRAFGLVIAVMSAVVSFFPIAFSLEKKGIIASVRRSIALCKSFPAFFVIVLVFIVTNAFIVPVVSPYGGIWRVITYFTGWFISSWSVATTYALWRDQLLPFKHV